MEVDTSTSLSHKQKETLKTMRPIFAILCNEQGVQYSANNSQALQTTRHAAKGKKSMRNMLEEEKASMSHDDHLAYNVFTVSLSICCFNLLLTGTHQKFIQESVENISR